MQETRDGIIISEAEIIALAEPSHTPGPWKSERSSPTHITSEKSLIATMFHGLKPITEAEANARLLAAAPDLLATLKDILSRFEDLLGPTVKGERNGEIEGDAEAIAQARTVIAKVTGE